MLDPKDTKGTKGTKGPGVSVPSPLSPETEQLVFDIIGAALRVHSRLGPGLLESIYRDALVVELEALGLSCEPERSAETKYRGRRLRRHRMDLVVASVVIVECKAVTCFAPVHSAQLVSYLRASGLRVGLLLNFNDAHLRDGIRRHVR
jgi:GxxExxY protein